MDDRRKSDIQKLVTGAASPSTRTAMEEESRSWMVRCPYCGHERSVWEMGGVRYKASGNPRKLIRCPQCSKVAWHKVYRKEGPDGVSPAVAVPPLADSKRRWLLWVVGLGLLVAVIVAFVTILLAVIGALTQPVVTAGDAFMTALKSSDSAQAYALCTPDLQKELGSASGLASMVQPDQPAQWSWGNRSIRNGVGRVEGSVTYTSGRTGTVRLVLEQVGNEWKVDSFSLNPN